MRIHVDLERDTSLILGSIEKAARKSIDAPNGDFFDTKNKYILSAKTDLAWITDEVESYRSHSLIFGLAFIFFLIVGITFVALSLETFLGKWDSTRSSYTFEMSYSYSRLVHMGGILLSASTVVLLGVRMVLKKNACLRETSVYLTMLKESIEEKTATEDISHRAS